MVDGRLTAPELYGHQKAAVNAGRGQPNFAYLMEMGTGKSAVVAREAAWLAANGKLDLLIIVAPDRVHRKWAEREIPLHGEYKNTVFQATHWIRPATTANQMKDIERDITNRRPVAVAFGYGAVSYRSKQGKASRLLHFLQILCEKYGSRTMLALDESHRIKSPSAKRTRSLQALGKRVRWRRILTGTPVTRGYEDLYSQFRFLDPRILGFSTYTEFKALHCVMGGFEGRQIVNYRYADLLMDKIRPFTFRAAKDECLDLPPKVYDQYRVELSAEQRQKYDALKDEYILWLTNTEAVDVELAITRLLRLQQIIGGHLPPAGPGEPATEIADVPRIGVVESIVEDALASSQQVIVWARFVPEVLRLARTLGDIATTYAGKLSDNQLELNLQSFKSGKKPVIIGTQSKGGIGLDMTEASVVIYYSNSFDYEHRAQSEDRAHRIGQTRSVLYCDLLAEDTLDTKLLKVLQQRKNLAEGVTRDQLLEIVK